MYGQTEGRTACVKTMITTGRNYGSAEWINKKEPFLSMKKNHGNNKSDSLFLQEYYGKLWQHIMLRGLYKTEENRNEAVLYINVIVVNL